MEISGVATRKITVARIPPRTDCTNVVTNALAANPFFAIGYPSKAVAIAQGAPGMLIRIAAREPPYAHPT